MAVSRSLASMTGFARVEGSLEALAWAWEVKSVNGKALELRFRLPPGFDALEQPLRQQAQARLGRGNLQVGLTLQRGTARPSLTVNEALLAELVAVAKRLESQGVAPARADGLLALKGVLESQEEATGEAAQKAREAALLADSERLFDRLAEMRRAEGAQLKALLESQLAELADLVKAATAAEAAQPEALRTRLRLLVEELLAASPALSEERLAQEAALLAVKADLREELDRLTAHIAAARDLISEGGAVGRRLDFLCQELNREANTLCSKSPDLELTRIGLAMKAAVDRLREQVQNVE